MEDKNLQKPLGEEFPELEPEIPEEMPGLDMDALPEELCVEMPVAEPSAQEEIPAEEAIPADVIPEAVPEEPEWAEASPVAEPTVDFFEETQEFAPEMPADSQAFSVEEPAPAVPVADGFDGEIPAEIFSGEDEDVLAFLKEDGLTEEISPEAASYGEQEEQEMPATEEPEPPTKSSRPMRKGRPRRKRKEDFLGIPQLLTTAVWLAIIVMIGVSLGRMLWVCAADVLAFGRESRDVVVTIQKEDTIEDIAEMLQQKGLIRYSGLFQLYASIAVDDGEIAPGTYTLNTILDYHALVGQMSPSSSSRAVVSDVLIPEGYNCRQIFELLEQSGICTVKELEDYAANGEFQDFWFLEGVERGDRYCLEGYLFPDTYDFYSNSTPREALGKMLLGFENRFTQEIYDKLPVLNARLSEMMRANGCSQKYIDNHQLSLRELLTVASLIEEETSGASESPRIASVIYNRLTQDQEYERYLNIDAAIIYATGDAEHIDTSVDSPYNTYLHAGLTPGPISNPGLSSINAALEFEDTDYYYYVLNPSTGEHQFSKTYEEHQKWVEKFRETESGEG